MATKSAASVKLSPLADRVVVKATEESEQMRGGLYIPDTAKEKPQQGEIVAESISDSHEEASESRPKRPT